MDSNLVARCFICNVECSAQEKYLGINIARTLTMQITSVLVKCLREIVDVDHDYFCIECVKKMENYDQLVQLSLQIETELYELYRKKTEEPCYLLAAEIISENPTNEERLLQTTELKLENSLECELPSDTIFNETYDDEMVIEYLDESDEDELIKEEQKGAVIKEPHENIGTEVENNKKRTASRKVKPKRGSVRSSGRALAAKIKYGKMDEPNEIKCEQCPYVGVSRSDLEEHKTLNHFEQIKKLMCDICGRSYKSKSALCVHIGNHNGRNSHECHICGKTFTQRGALVRHMPMHTGEQPHQCDVCGKRFTHYSSFHMHQMIHTNERKKKCTICGSEFRSNSHMTRHMRSHTGEKPFSCPICGQKFAQRYNMKTHYNTHQGIHRPQSRTHKCVICSEGFPRREKLNKHLRQSHRISDEDIKNIAEHGPESEITKEIIDRLRANVYTKEEVFVEFEAFDSGEIMSSDTLT